MKILGIFVISLLTLFFNEINTSKTRSHTSIGSGVFSLGLSKYKHRIQSKIKTVIKSFSTTNSGIKKKVKLLPGIIYFEGWIRFFKYSGEEQLRPNNFFTNHL